MLTSLLPIEDRLPPPSNVTGRVGSRIIDGTVGAGGHAMGVLEHTAPEGELLGLLDQIEQASREASVEAEASRVLK